MNKKINDNIKKKMNNLKIKTPLYLTIEGTINKFINGMSKGIYIKYIPNIKKRLILMTNIVDEATLILKKKNENIKKAVIGFLILFLIYCISPGEELLFFVEWYYLGIGAYMFWLMSQAIKCAKKNNSTKWTYWNLLIFCWLFGFMTIVPILILTQLGIDIFEINILSELRVNLEDNST